MTDDSGRNPDGTFREGNTASMKSGGGYGLEKQVHSGKVSAHLWADALERLERIQDGGAGEMHDELAALALSVVDGLQATFSQAVKAYSQDARQIEKVYSASRHLHTWLATSARLLQWRAEHPDGDGKTSAATVLEAIRGNDNDGDK